MRAQNTTQPPSTKTPNPWRWLARRAAGMIDAGAAVAAVATVAGFLGGSWWVLDLFAHFRAQYAVAFAAALVVAVNQRRRLAASLAVAGLVTNGLLLWPLFAGPRPKADPARPVMRVLTFNVLYDNPNEPAVLDFVRRSNADIVLLIEVTPRWAQAVETLKEVYPHRHVRPREGPWGMALLSRQPWTSVRFESFALGEPLAVVATFTTPAGPFLFVGAHPTTPVSRDGAHGRNEFLSGLATHLGNNHSPEIIAGDLNATRWSAPFRGLMKSAGLHDSAEGRGWQPTWKRRSIVQIPIDHVLVSDHWTVTNCEIGPDLGSDHRPVIVDVQLESRR